MYNYQGIKENGAKFNIVLCTESGDGFESGCLYASIGTNNGIHVLRENEIGDVEDMIYMTAGHYAEAWDASGKPTFDLVFIGR